jgi:hypothetical protein
MATITLRLVKGTPLTNAEVDDNFSNINTELGGKLVAANNLSDLANVATAQTNLQVDPAGTAVALAIALG